MVAASGVLLPALVGLATFTYAAFDIGYGSDDDLSKYITRPEIKAPLFDVTVHEPEQVTPGYWFIAPYARIAQEKHPVNYFQACQIGPSIYDSSGELIWSGACLVENQNTCDFRVFEANGSTFLSAILTPYHPKDITGHAIMLDSSMQITQGHHTPNALVPFNMHEFLVVGNGKTAMHIIQKSQLMDVSQLKDSRGIKSGLVVDMGIREFDPVTGETIFTWWAGDHINLNASTFPARSLNGPFPMA